MDKIFIVGMGCVYSEANTLTQFWETILTQRCGFRTFPPQRLALAEYGSANLDERDKTYVQRAAFIHGFNFDWKQNRIPKPTFEVTDPAHWLALNTAIAAINDAGVDLDAVGRERIGVIIGNSLTGEISRANMLRLRWPYVRNSLITAARNSGIDNATLSKLIVEAEHSFKQAFPIPNEDTLAGVLSNVIAGRICNFLDFNGGGYVVDGACASSLLAVSNACEALIAKRLDMVIAGGVDISLDPLEMVGFARTGAFTNGAMQVYDHNAAGFLPGEGCGMVVLMREHDVVRFGLKPWAQIAGWGISSDGAGGITAPKATAQALAMRRCYELCGFNAATLDFIEGHGTGTPVGDREELLGFIAATFDADIVEQGRDEQKELRRTGVTSIKTLLGHTKAAAGAAGLIKAVLAVNQRVLPPLAGLRAPAAAFKLPEAQIYPLTSGQCLAPEIGLRAGVSGAGFGGINCHIAITGEDVAKRNLATKDAQFLLASTQQAELFITSADSVAELVTKLANLLSLAQGIAEAELVDLAAWWAFKNTGATVRAALVATNVLELQRRLEALIQVLPTTTTATKLSLPLGTQFAQANLKLRIGFLLPGQGSQFLRMGKKLPQRFGWAATRQTRWDRQFATLGATSLSKFIDRPLERANNPEIITDWNAVLTNTQVAQPAIVMTSLQWLQWLGYIGIMPDVVAGHSLGEIPALVAAGMLSEVEAIEIVRIRATACARTDLPPGGMLAVKCGIQMARTLLSATTKYAVIANDNAHDQVVIAGAPEALEEIKILAQVRGIQAMNLKVSQAFHSQYMQPAAQTLENLATVRGEVRTAQVPFISGVDGRLAPRDFDPFAYLAQQIVAPVRFREVVTELAQHCDLCIEIGPGSVLSGLVHNVLKHQLPVCSLEPGAGNTDVEFCAAIGELFVNGAVLDWKSFYAGRFHRPFIPAAELNFITNPCSHNVANVAPELIAATEPNLPRQSIATPLTTSTLSIATPQNLEPLHGIMPLIADDIAELIRRLVAEESGYDLDTIPLEANLSRDLRLDSIKIAELRAKLRTQHIAIPEGFPFGNAPIREIARVATKIQHVSDTNSTATTTGNQQFVAMPKDLPILGFSLDWQNAPSLLVGEGGHEGKAISEPIVIIHGRRRTQDAERLIEQLLALGIPAKIDDGTSQLKSSDNQPIRLVVLPGGRTAADRLTALFARVGTQIATGVAAIILIARDDFAPIFGFAQSLALEMPGLPILGIEVTANADLAPLALQPVAPGVQLKRLTAAGITQTLHLKPWQPHPEPVEGCAVRQAHRTQIPLQPQDIVVVSGGAKGITAECTLALLQTTGARAILLGTTAEAAPGAEVTKTLQRFHAANLTAIYLSCDVTSHHAVSVALKRGVELMGASFKDIKGLIHGAGLNIPTPVTKLDAASLFREYAIKVSGLNNLVNVIGADNLNLCVGLGSIIGVVGMHGNSGYAVANEAMAATLVELKHNFPHLHVACPAYSVWAEVGMGAKLDVVNTLAQQHISAIPIADGTRWFLDCCSQPNVPIPLAITGSMHGLPTWRQLRGTDVAVGLPYVVNHRIVHEPNLLLVARPLLSPQRDQWIADHSFRGTLLLATVQALNCVGAGAQLLAGNHVVVTRFTNLHIARPIIIAQHGDTTIEIDVRRTATGWTGHVGSPGTAWTEPAFAMHCQLGISDGEKLIPTNTDTIDAHWQPVATEVSAQLYAWILFQGPTFQRIKQLQALNLHDATQRRGRFQLQRERAEPNAPLPDIFFLDAMLQTVQILVPRDVCLPTSIDEIIFYAAAWEAGMTTVEATIIERTATGYITQVKAWNTADSALVASFYGYGVNIVTTNVARPDAKALLNPLQYDQDAVAQWLQAYVTEHKLQLQLGLITQQEPTARRTSAASQIAAQLGCKTEAIIWNQNGAPLCLDQPNIGIAIAHDGTRLLTVCGSGRIGCDLQRVGHNRVWTEILPPTRIPLWHELTQALQQPDHAGAVVWAIHEALIKAKADKALVTFAGMHNGMPQFELNELATNSMPGLLIAGIVELVLAGPTGIALVQLPDTMLQRVTHYSRDIEMTFKEAIPPLKSPTASIYFNWMGALREEAMSTIRIELAQAFSEQSKGMVTNETRIRIEYPITFTTPLRAWVWLNQVLTTSPSTFELKFQWAELGPNKLPVRIVAEGLQRLTWVNIEPNGQVNIESFPSFFANFIAERLPLKGAKPFTPPLGHKLETDSAELPVWRRDATVNADFATGNLMLHTDDTHSNFVGNIYFSHLATLVERACHNVLRQMKPNDIGSFYTTTLHLTHVAEAMPGDVLEAMVQLYTVGLKHVTFHLAIVNKSHADVTIATGQARFRLFTAAGVNAESLSIQF